ncbi:MAG: hypothetical protein ING72_10665 [Methylobacterium sp.]|jgi:hypothetical protein|nr:hypothetical protein [Methylobacterium sp.]MCA3598201.1 hypothetical protein [Methylobacterium sp.]MCA3602453.1 hypothetical protein [Methylobacterium sp.]MCA3610841.1 hypothetical protein [Methylobacterium sp.]MCA3613829.1 hypothetical protein [Methylobacterium sp.]
MGGLVMLVEKSGRLRGVALAALGLSLMVLAGCGSSSLTESGSGDPKVAGDGSGWGTAILYGGRRFTEPPPTEKREYTCPTVEILDGTVALRSGDTGTARGVGYQASIRDTARECALVDGNRIQIKVGVQGRLVLGESGKPGTYTVPVRVAVRRTGGETVYSKLTTASVTVPATDTQGSFTVIDEGLSLPLSASDPGDEYTILVGLDPQGKSTPRNRRR